MNISDRVRSSIKLASFVVLLLSVGAANETCHISVSGDGIAEFTDASVEDSSSPDVSGVDSTALDAWRPDASAPDAMANPDAPVNPDTTHPDAVVVLDAAPGADVVASPDATAVPDAIAVSDATAVPDATAVSDAAYRSDQGGQVGVFVLSAQTYFVAESAGMVEVEVLRIEGTQGATGVSYSTRRLGDGQPPYAQDVDFSTPGDYDGQYATLHFADGVVSQTFTVTILDDTLDESDETFEVYLLEPTGGASIGPAASSRATVTITDDDEPSSSFCPDGSCDADETCTSCSEDCGPCAGECGDSHCDADESCSSCAVDCGVCTSGATFVGNFDTGAVGSAPTGSDGYSDGAARGPRPATYDTTRAFSGTQSAKISTATDEKFFGIAGMSVPGGSLAQGDEIWRQEKFWIPGSFDFTGGQPAVKWINYAPNNGTGRVYWNLRAGGWSLISETDSGSGYLNISAPIPRDQWVTVETWMKVTSVTEPCMRLWVNGVFLGEKTTNTIDNPGYLIDEIRLGDYWNTGAPSNQSFWVDDLKIYSSRAGNIPTRFDSGGRRYIGVD